MPQLICDGEQVLFVLRVEDDGVGSFRDVVVSSALAGRMDQLGRLLTNREVGPDDDVVIRRLLSRQGLPGPEKGGKWGKRALGSLMSRRRKLGLTQATDFVSEARVRGPLVGSTAVVVRSSSCPTR